MRGVLRLPSCTTIVLGIVLLAGTAGASSQHTPGMSLTAEILAENAPALQGSGAATAESASDTSATDSTAAGTASPVPANAPGTITGHVRDAESGQIGRASCRERVSFTV